MKTILLVTTDSSFPALDGWQVTRVRNFVEAHDLVGLPWFAVVVDARNDLSVDDLLQWRKRRKGTEQAVAILPAGDGQQARLAAAADVACVDASWADSNFLCQILRGLTEHAELATIREQREQLIQNEKFAAVGLLAAEIAHEINNPTTFVITNLTVMIDYVQTIGLFHAELRDILANGEGVDLPRLAELEDRHEIAFLGEDLDTLLERSLAGLHRIHQIVRDLRYFGADRTTASGLVDIDGLVRAAVNLVGHEARFRATVEVELPTLPVVQSDANRLSQVILNVLVNAVQAIPAGNVADNCVSFGAKVTDQMILLSVTDTGTGIADDLLERVFDPFYTTKAPGGGSGLGLAISRDIMRSLGGDIRVHSDVGTGSRFEVLIPRGKLDE